jgi:predicted O-methyltransferase YrrM
VIAKDKPQPPAGETACRIGERIAEIYTLGSVVGDDEQPHSLRGMSIPDDEGRFIADLIRSEKPHATLEIGMAWGVSTLFILQALFENGASFRPHVIMDPSQDRTFHNAALRSLRDLAINEMVEFYQEPSELVLPRLVQEGRIFDLAFVDGNHHFEYVFTDLRFIHQLLRPGGLVIFDDTDWVGVNLACSFAVANYGYRAVAEFSPDHDAAKPDPSGTPRARARAYRKPLEEIDPGADAFAPFFLDFVPRELLEQMLRAEGRDLRHKGHIALRAGDRAQARNYFKLALAYDPARLTAYLRLLRTYLPLRISRALGKPKRTFRA